MRIYVVSLIAESMGVHLGQWIDLAEYSDHYMVEDDIFTELTMFEWRIDKIDAPLAVSTQTPLDVLIAIQLMLDDEWTGEAFLLYAKYHKDIQYALDYFEDAYHGCWRSLEDYALDFYEEAYGDPAPPGYRVEIDEIAWRCDFDDIDGPSGTHIFACV
ncbi:antirestriction protein ArdA [Actinomadura oligospora]|uniref:antirestriction protein ArdA n=1 Tax=Actinomadura oligospora TaxID=111804 RepID=UPI00047CD9EC|nr:antirestriction protein ArdA [Actinomadura oligospora]